MTALTTRLTRASAALILSGALLLAGCGFLGGTNGNSPPGGVGNTNGIPNTPVTMTSGGFSPTSVSIRADQSVEFANSTPSTPLTVCIGQDGKCSDSGTGPSSLRWPPGMGVAAGKTTDVVFDTSGTYHVTIENQSGSNLTVTVQ